MARGKEKYQANRSNQKNSTESNKKVAKIATKALVDSYTDGQGGSLVDKFANTKVGDAALNKMGKSFEKQNPGASKITKKLDDVGALDTVDKGLSMFNSGATKNMDNKPTLESDNLSSKNFNDSSKPNLLKQNNNVNDNSNTDNNQNVNDSINNNKDNNNDDKKDSSDKSKSSGKLFNFKDIKTKILLYGAPVLGFILLILLITVAISSVYDETIGKVKRGVDAIIGVVNDVVDYFAGDDGDEEEVNEELSVFVSNVKNVLSDYPNGNIGFNAIYVTSAFILISTEKEISLNSVSSDSIKDFVDLMYNDDGNYDETYFRENLVGFFNLYFSGYSEDQLDNLIESYFMIIADFNEYYPDTTNLSYTSNSVVSESYWWPIGSSNTTTKNGKIFASDTPVTVNITSYYGNRIMYGEEVFHNGIDIANGSAEGEVNIIAVKSGEVIYPTANDVTNYGAGSYGNTDGGGFGNYVKIRHNDGTITVYAHLYADSITVTAGDMVEQGQVIGKMGTSGSSTGVHLHFGVYVGGDSSANVVDPIQYIDPADPRPASTGADFSLTSTTLSEEEFVAKLQDYYNRTGNANFLNNFLNNAREIYQASADYGVNPELVVVTAATESGFRGCGTTGNYWGIGIPNGQGCLTGPSYATMRDGVKGYAETLASYNPGGSYANSITARYNERSAAGCQAGGYGLPGTLAGMQSVYSWLGDYRYNPGSSGRGGCYYLENGLMYGAGYCSTVPTCSNYSSCPSDSKTTVCEQSDYTLLQITQKLKVRQDIFGL